MKRHLTTKGFSLPFAIFIFIVIVILSGSLVSAVYLNNTIYNRVLWANRLESNSTSAINILLVHPDAIEYDVSKGLSLFGEYGDSVSLKKEQWGLFDIIHSEAKFKNMKKGMAAIIGSYSYDSSNVALRIPDQGRAIAMAGNALVEGNCMIPKAGFTQTSIEGKYYTGKKIKQGIVHSSNKLPDLSSKYANLNLEYAIKKYRHQCKSILFNEWSGDSLFSSFLDTTISLYSKGILELSNVSLKGKIVVISESNIILKSSANMADVLCFAPFIHVQSGFKGKVQLFATDSIRIEPECTFLYPSVAGVSYSDETGNATLSIGEKCDFCGITYVYCPNETTGKNSILSIGKGSTIKGQVYSNRYTEIKGNVFGALYTSQILLRTASAIYENIIMDASIDMTRLSQNYVGADLIEEGTTGNIIRWIY